MKPICTIMIYLFALTSDSAFGQQSAQPKELSNTRLYYNGIGLLKRGSQLDVAVDYLEQSVRQKPNDPEYLSALGCAYASRFESIVLDIRRNKAFEMNMGSFNYMTDLWKMDQSDDKKRLYGLQPPPMPDKPETLKENIAIVSSPDKSAAELTRLCKAAKEAFDKAHIAATTSPVGIKISVEYERGWGLFLLRRYGNGVISGLPTSGRPNVHTDLDWRGAV